MKNYLTKTILAIVITMSFVSCSKDDGPTFSEENFLPGYLTNSGFSAISSSHVDSGNYEFGVEFTPLVKGKITALRVKLPAVNNSLRITIWDKATTTPIRTETVNVNTFDTEQSFDITDLELTADHQYALTMNSNDWYERERTGGTNATYPITSNNIKIDSYKWISGTTQSYPTNLALNYYAGDLSFNFIQVE
ncbi:MAG: DUF4082 domain-containing protein [Flavobacterium sp.]|nr:DUF4082 domain-containing protein [Flavobacterium sp.]